MTTPDAGLEFGGYFLGGLALNLTPCVYPMLSVTVSVFSNQKTATGVQSFARALAYVLGMAASYSALGVTAALTGGFFGAWLQDRRVLVAIAAVIAALATSMFGWWRFEIPASWLSRLGGRSRAGAGWAGLFVSGLGVGLFAAPCIGPPVVALLARVSERQSVAYGLASFFTLAMGLGFPYLLLGTFSHWTSRIPKSGVWLVWVERVFGWVLLGFAGYYLLSAVHPEGLRWLLPASLLGAGTHLAFGLHPDDRGRGGLALGRKAVAGALIAGALIRTGFMLAPEPAKLVWTPYSQSSFDAATASGRPTVVDFYADWCLPCHEMEEITFKNTRVTSVLERFNRLRADYTTQDNPELLELAERYGVQGLPALLFWDARGDHQPAWNRMGFQSPQKFLALAQEIESTNSTGD